METECVAHHWLIATPKGETSASRCVKCGAVKLFRNGFEWGRNDEVVQPSIERVAGMMIWR